MAWICITVLQHCSGSLTESKKLGAQEQSGVGQQKREKAEAGWGGGGGGGVTGINRELVQGKGQDGGALCAINQSAKMQGDVA